MMIFKIISKKRYEALIEENIKLSTAIESMGQLENVNNGHVCNGLCKGCKHLVKSEEGYYRGYGMYYNAYECDLNRTCEDYEAEYALSGRPIENLIEAETKRKERMREIKVDTIKEFLNEIKKTIIGVDVNYTDADGCADRCTEAVPVEWIKKVEQKFEEVKDDETN